MDGVRFSQKVSMVSLRKIESRAAGVLLVGMVLVVFGCNRRDRTLNFQTIAIDTQTMTVELSGPFPGINPPQAQYYTIFRSQSGIGIYHYDGANNLPHKVRYNAFGATHDKRLRSRSKQQELARSSYGTVYANTYYRYLTSRGSDFDVRLYDNKAEHEPAQIVLDLPRPTPSLSAISLVRVIHMHPKYAVLTAVYQADGTLKGANIFWSEGGNWIAGQFAAQAKDEGVFRTTKDAPEKLYGLPLRFPIAEYLEGQPWFWKDVGKPNPENVINFHYDYNRWVRQDVFDAAAKRTTRYLTYVWTLEDEILKTIDRKLPFGTTKSE